MNPDPATILADLAILADCDPPASNPVGATLTRLRRELGKERLKVAPDRPYRLTALESLEVRVWRCYHWRDLGYKVVVRHCWYKAPRRALAAQNAKGRAHHQHLIYYLVRMSWGERLAHRLESLIYRRS